MITFLKENIKLTDDELKIVLSKGREKELKEKEIIFEPGHVFNKFYFVQSGILRSFRLIDSEDYTLFFFSTNEFGIDFESFLTETPSSLYFESVTKCSVIEFSKSSLINLSEMFPKMEKLRRIIAEQVFLAVHERLKQFQTDNLELRYLKLIERAPELFQAVPQYHIASYLGVKPQSLSRIRAKLVSKK